MRTHPTHQPLWLPEVTMRISEVLDGQGDVVTIGPDAGVGDLVELLARHNIGAVVVRSAASGPLEGIVSERDVVRRLHDDRDVLDGPVSAIMTAVVHTCAPSDSVDDLMGLMTRHRVRHVPVVSDDALVGIVSIGDVVKSRIGQLEFERDQLDSYLHQT